MNLVEIEIHVIPPLSLDDSLEDENVESGEDDDGSNLSSDKRVDTVQHRVVPGITSVGGFMAVKTGFRQQQKLYKSELRLRGN